MLFLHSINTDEDMSCYMSSRVTKGHKSQDRMTIDMMLYLPTQLLTLQKFNSSTGDADLRDLNTLKVVLS